jgi:hypothetical protein
VKKKEKNKRKKNGRDGGCQVGGVPPAYGWRPLAEMK